MIKYDEFCKKNKDKLFGIGMTEHNGKKVIRTFYSVLYRGVCHELENGKIILNEMCTDEIIAKGGFFRALGYSLEASDDPR